MYSMCYKSTWHGSSWEKDGRQEDCCEKRAGRWKEKYCTSDGSKRGGGLLRDPRLKPKSWASCLFPRTRLNIHIKPISCRLVSACGMFEWTMPLTGLWSVETHENQPTQQIVQNSLVVASREFINSSDADQGSINKCVTRHTLVSLSSYHASWPATTGPCQDVCHKHTRDSWWWRILRHGEYKKKFPLLFFVYSLLLSPSANRIGQSCPAALTFFHYNGPSLSFSRGRVITVAAFVQSGVTFSVQSCGYRSRVSGRGARWTETRRTIRPDTTQLTQHLPRQQIDWIGWLFNPPAKEIPLPAVKATTE